MSKSRRLALGALAAFLLALSARPQGAPPAPDPAEALDIGGFKIQLGMPLDLIVRGLSNNYNLQQIGAAPGSESSWIIETKGGPPQITVASLAFTGGKLSSAYKYWAGTNEPGMEASFAGTLYGAEGLGEWEGRPAWQIRFEERTDRHNSISALVMDGRSFGLRLRGRAWILADSYQVARLESDLVIEIPEIRLRLQHEDIEYRHVKFRNGKVGIWLPSSCKFYMDFHGHRFYRLHRFTDFELFSVNFRQSVDNPTE